MAYHPGIVIKKYRKLKGWTQQKLAEHWPRADGGIGVDWRYVQFVESGKRNVTDQQVLRKLSDLLDIPLWEFGYSEYDPYTQSISEGKRIYSETLDTMEMLINHTLAMRRYTPLPEVERNAQAVSSKIAYFQKSFPVPARLENKFVSLLIQRDNLIGLMYFEHDEHKKAMALYERMYEFARQLDDPAHLILALTKLSVNHMRFNHMSEAVEAGELARDISFKASKQAAAYANAYLAHIYGADKDLNRFERAMNIAVNIAEPLGDAYGDVTDFIHHKFSGILQLRSRGYLRLNQPRKVLDLHDELQRHISADANIWLDHRLHLYSARAYLMLKDIEACIEATRQLFREVKDWKSPHRLSRAYELLEAVDKAGYGDLRIVREFKEELRSQ